MYDEYSEVSDDESVSDEVLDVSEGVPTTQERYRHELLPRDRELSYLATIAANHLVQKVWDGQMIPRSDLTKKLKLLCLVIAANAKDVIKLIEDNPLDKSEILKAYVIYLAWPCDVSMCNEEDWYIWKQSLRGAADNAKDHIVRHNLRLVMKIAWFYSRGRENNPLTGYDDLVQQGMFGLIDAVEKYDITTGHRFSTYATWWIRQSITRYLADMGLTLRLPAHLIELRNRIARYKSDCIARGVKPTVDSIIIGLNLLPEEAENALIAYHEQGVALGAYTQIVKEQRAKVARVIEFGDASPSLDFEIDGDEGDSSTLAELTADMTAVDPQVETEKNNLRDMIRRALGMLSDREREVLELRFGLNGREFTLEEVGKHFGVTRERIRQIEAKALAKLRNPERNADLIEYVA